MKCQLSLFSTEAKKRKFFDQALDTTYLRVIEHLWQLDNGKRSQNQFHKWAQKQWKDVYTENKGKHNELFISGSRAVSTDQMTLNSHKCRGLATLLLPMIYLP
jgi:hypothetical protein